MQSARGKNQVSAEALQKVRAFQIALASKPRTGEVYPPRVTNELVQAFADSGMIECKTIGSCGSLSLLHYCVREGYFELAIECLKMGADPMALAGKLNTGEDGACVPLVRLTRSLRNFSLWQLRRVPGFLDQATQLGMVFPARHTEPILMDICVFMASSEARKKEPSLVETLQKLLFLGVMSTPREGGYAVSWLVDKWPSENTIQVVKMLINFGADISLDWSKEEGSGGIKSTKEKMTSIGGPWLEVIEWDGAQKEKLALFKSIQATDGSREQNQGAVAKKSGLRL